MLKANLVNESVKDYIQVQEITNWRRQAAITATDHERMSAEGIAGGRVVECHTIR